MQIASKLGPGARTELASHNAQQPCRTRARNVVMAAHQSDKQMPQMAVAAAAALLLTSAQPASAALGPTLYESGEKNAQELQDIIAARGKGLPDLVDVPAATEAFKAAKDVPLEKVQGVIKQTKDAVPDSVPNPLPAMKDPPAAVKPQEFFESAPQAVKEAPKAASQAAKQAASSAPSLPSVPAPPAEGPSQTTILGAVAIVVAGGGAVAAAGKQGELPSTGDVQAGASQAAGAAKDAASKAESAAESAVQKAESAVEKAPQSAEEAEKAAKESAAEAREWIKNWRDKQA